MKNLNKFKIMRTVEQLICSIVSATTIFIFTCDMYQKGTDNIIFGILSILLVVSLILCGLCYKKLNMLMDYME